MDKKPGRNDPCFCGSGKKYKNCCLGKEAKKTYTEGGKRKFKATVLQSGGEKSRSVFEGTTPAPTISRDIKPIELGKFRKTKSDYRTKVSEEGLSFNVGEEGRKPESVEQKVELLPETFEGTGEDFREKS